MKRRKARTYRLMISADGWLHFSEINCRFPDECAEILLREVLQRPVKKRKKP